MDEDNLLDEITETIWVVQYRHNERSPSYRNPMSRLWVNDIFQSSFGNDPSKAAGMSDKERALKWAAREASEDEIRDFRVVRVEKTARVYLEEEMFSGDTEAGNSGMGSDPV